MLYPINERIRKLIQKYNLSAHAFALELGYNNSETIRGVVNDEREASGKVIKRIIERYKEVNPKWLINGGDDSEMLYRDNLYQDSNNDQKRDAIIEDYELSHQSLLNEYRRLRAENEVLNNTLKDKDKKIDYLEELLKKVKEENKRL